MTPFELLSKNKQGLTAEKDNIINEINECVKHHFDKNDLKSLFYIRQFIDEKQSYFALNHSLIPPTLTLNGFNINILLPNIVKEIYQDAININEELRAESNKIYSDLFHSLSNKSS